MNFGTNKNYLYLIKTLEKINEINLFIIKKLTLFHKYEKSVVNTL